MTSLVWLITGCSTGFGREIALAALNRGDKVIATARNVTKIESLGPEGADILQLDVTSSLQTLNDVVAKAHGLHGRIDVLVNNAGYLLQGAIEEATPDETFNTFNTNVFGALNTTRAVLPYMRKQRSGVIGNISSVGGWGGGAGAGLYHANKWALSGASESLTAELADFGIAVCSIEPGYFRSSLLTPGNRLSTATTIPDYDSTVGRVRNDLDAITGNQPGDVKKGAQVIVDVLTSSGKAEGKAVPLRIALGPDATEFIKDKCSKTIALLDEWADITGGTNL
ncbi:MAG: hypothetical protein M1837_002628 [Sclerophora amabilis]|nr:MAG: hypothetical protein M1837_002628 [Sclerophora amabilis]